MIIAEEGSVVTFVYNSLNERWLIFMEIRIGVEVDREAFLKSLTDVARRNLLSSDDYESDLLAEAKNMLAFHLSNTFSSFRDKREFRSHRKDWENGVSAEVVYAINENNCFIVSVVKEAIDIAMTEVQERISMGRKKLGD